MFCLHMNIPEKRREEKRREEKRREEKRREEKRREKKRIVKQHKLSIWLDIKTITEKRLPFIHQNLLHIPKLVFLLVYPKEMHWIWIIMTNEIAEK
ncbi:hypothetical protein TURU_161384 [Turdus rufiventris]|nr:hypothetical protein TURU_161384 [Turdus rufiventris]